MTDFGIWTLIPPILVIVLAIVTKKPTLSLLLGCLSSYAIIAIGTKANFITMSTEAFYSVLTDETNVNIICICALFGSLIALLNASNGTTAFARFIAKFCKTEKSVMLASWILGCVIFIDDYMNIMAISSCFKKSFDDKKIPRAALAYIIDSTGAPACVLLPFSTWAVFYAYCFYEQKAVVDLGYASAMSSYVHAIPYMFYAALALIMVVLFIYHVVPTFGPMKKEYEAMAKKQIEEAQEDTTEKKGHLIDFVLPLAVMIFVSIMGDDMFIALLASIITCFILYIPRKVVNINDFFILVVKGIGDLMPTLLVLMFAFYMKQACADIYLTDYVVNVFSPLISAKTFPLFTFVLVSILSFVTGDSWGVPAICVPIFIPLASVCGAHILLTMGAIVSGGVFCSHACFYSDATVLTATCSEVTPMCHAKTQLPYAMICFAISAVLYLVLGFVL